MPAYYDIITNQSMDVYTAYDGYTIPVGSTAAHYLLVIKEELDGYVRIVHLGIFATIDDANAFIADNPAPATIFTEIIEPES